MTNNDLVSYPRTGRDALLAAAQSPAALADYLFNLEGFIATFTGAEPTPHIVVAPMTFQETVTFQATTVMSGGAVIAGNESITGNLTVGGNLTVVGTETIDMSETLLGLLTVNVAGVGTFDLARFEANSGLVARIDSNGSFWAGNDTVYEDGAIVSGLLSLAVFMGTPVGGVAIGVGEFATFTVGPNTKVFSASPAGLSIVGQAGSAVSPFSVFNVPAGFVGTLASWQVGGVQKAHIDQTGTYFAGGSTAYADGSITPTGGSSLTLPVVVADTFAVLAAVQTLTNKTLTTPTINGATLSGTLSGAATFSGVLTLSATTAFTNASPFSMTNAQVVTVALTAQTVGAATLTVPNFAGVSDTFAFLTLAQTLVNKTLTTPTINGATISGTLAGAATFSGVLTLSATTAFTNASPFSMTNAQVVTVALTAQTVGAATLTVPNFAGVSDTYAFVTLAQTFANKTLTTPTINGATLSGTLSGAATFSGVLTLSATTAFTAASPFSMTNAQVVTVALTAQTVGAATLTVPNFAGVSDTFAFLTLAQTLANKTLASPVFTGDASYHRSLVYGGPALTGAGTSGTLEAAIKAGAPVDADFAVPADGMIVGDTTDSKIYIRLGGTWKSVAVA